MPYQVGRPIVSYKPLLPNAVLRSANLAELQCTPPPTTMRGLIYTALVIAVAGICANAELNITVEDADFPEEKRLKMCEYSCGFSHHGLFVFLNVRSAYDELNNGGSSEDLFNAYCPSIYGYEKCMSNCKKALNVVDKIEQINVDAPIQLGAIVRKSCTGLIEKLSTLKTLTECSSKIYPLIAKPEENAKCRKMCCSNPNAVAPLYACNKPEYSFSSFFLSDYDRTNDVDRKENMCQLACVIDQAAKHAHIECSTVLTEMLFVARQDVQKIYQQLEKKIEEEKRIAKETSTNTPLSFKIHLDRMFPLPTASKMVETTTTVQPTVKLIKQEAEYSAMNERYFYKMNEPIKTEDSNF